MSSSNRAAHLFQVLGEYLPKEVFEHLSVLEMEKLFHKIGSTKKPNLKEENQILSEFIRTLKGKKHNQDSRSHFLPQANSAPELGIHSRTSNPQPTLFDEDTEEIFLELEKILLSEAKEIDPLSELGKMPKELLQKLCQGEDIEMIARILCFAEPDEAAMVLESFTESIREEVIIAIGDLEPNSLQERDRLVRFLSFKLKILGEGGSVQKVKARSAKTAGDLLSKISPKSSEKILSKLQKKSREYAETIREHTFFLEDLIQLDRSDLKCVLEDVHPVVLAFATKGMEISASEILFSKMEPWYRNQVLLESESLGPVSLREIEESQKGLVEHLQNILSEGKLQIRRNK